MSQSITAEPSRDKHSVSAIKTQRARFRVRLTVGDDAQTLRLADIRDPDRLQQIQHRIGHENSSARVQIQHFLTTNDQDRRTVLKFMASLPRARFAFRKNNQEWHDLLGAVLDLFVPELELSVVAKIKEVAIYAAIIVHPDDLEIASGRIAMKLKQIGEKGARQDKILRECQSCRREIQDLQATPNDRAGRTVNSIVPDAPVADDILVPPGWELSESGITSSLWFDGTLCIPAHVVITRRLRDRASSTEQCELLWLRNATWQRAVVARGVIASARSIVELASIGLPVTTNSAPMLVQYLADFESENLARLPLGFVSAQLGWYDLNGTRSFLWGPSVITADGVSNAASGQPPAVTFCGTDEGDQQLARGYHSAGSFDDWLDAVRVFVNDPRAILAIVASLAVPLLEICRAPNFVVSYSGPTTSGKTTILRGAASVWGCPDDAGHQKGCAVFSWDSTAVWRERALGVLNGLPLLMDESKHVRDPDDVAKTIYAAVQGNSRGRGTPKGLAKSTTCRTILMSSGEQPATSFTHDGGIRARVLEIWGSPFTGGPDVAGPKARQFAARVREHYGHAGPKFVHELLKSQSKWPEYRRCYSKLVQHYHKLADSNVIAGRMAENFAILTLTFELAQLAKCLPDEFQDPTAELHCELIGEAAGTDPVFAALRSVVEFAQSHPDRFDGAREKDASNGRTVPIHGWAGRWHPEHGKWKLICFLPFVLEQILRESGHDPISTIRNWAERCWLETSSEKKQTRNQYKCRVGKESVWTIAIRREALVELGLADDEIVDEHHRQLQPLGTEGNTEENEG